MPVLRFENRPFEGGFILYVARPNRPFLPQSLRPFTRHETLQTPVVGDQAAGTYQGLRTEGMTAPCLLIGKQEELWMRCRRT